MNLNSIADLRTDVEMMFDNPENAEALKHAPPGMKRATDVMFSILDAGASPDSVFPLYAMWSKTGEGEETFHLLTLYDAGVLYDSGWVMVEFGNFVLESALKLRPMTDAEKIKISDIADEHSARK